MINRKDFIASFFPAEREPVRAAAPPVVTHVDDLHDDPVPLIEAEPITIPAPTATAPEPPPGDDDAHEDTDGDIVDDDEEEGPVTQRASGPHIEHPLPARYHAFRAREAERRKHKHQTAPGCWVDKAAYEKGDE
jgi:hypothetical protein